MNQNSSSQNRHRVCITEERTTFTTMTDAELAEAGIPLEGLRSLSHDEATGALILTHIQLTKVVDLPQRELPWKLQEPA